MKTTDNYLIKSYDNRVKIKRVIETINHGTLPLIPEATPDNLNKIPWLDKSFLSAKQGLKIVVQLFVIESNNKIIIMYKVALLGFGKIAGFKDNLNPSDPKKNLWIVFS